MYNCLYIYIAITFGDLWKIELDKRFLCKLLLKILSITKKTNKKLIKL